MLSLVTSVKDYVEITHKFIEVEPLKNYNELGALFSYLILSIGTVLKDFFSFSLNVWSIPIIIPDVASAMISEVSVLDGYFHSAFTFLETNVASSPTGSTPVLLIFEKFFIGLVNSLFLFLPTSTSHLITLRRFVMQGLEAGYLAGLGTMAGNFLWIASVILGWRFFVIPWLSFDIFRYFLGFILLVKYIWDSSKERRMPLENLSKWKIFGLNFLLALTEQTCIYPFISNLSFGPEASILEGFASDNSAQFLLIHGAYLFGILIGSFSLLQFACWFWENPAFSIYIWITTKASNSSATGTYYKILNFTLLYFTMLCAIASIPYFGLDYTITNPIGLVPQDRIIFQKKSQFDNERLIPETAFLGVNPTDKNTRIRDGIHARRERWKQRLIKYQAYDASVYDQGVYDFLTMEDLNYGFDRFWLRRKMRNHQIRFRLFPGPWMRSLKKQLNKPANFNNKEDKAYTAPRVEFFRILFEQFYHPNFHDRSRILSTSKTVNLNKNSLMSNPNNMDKIQQETSQLKTSNITSNNAFASISSWTKSGYLPRSYPNNYGALNLLNSKKVKPGLIYEHSALRKFVRNFNTRQNLKNLSGSLKDNPLSLLASNTGDRLIYSKRWKSLLAKTRPYKKTSNFNSYLLFRNLSQKVLNGENNNLKLKSIELTGAGRILNQSKYMPHFSNPNNQLPLENSGTLLRPLSFYLQKDQAFKRKLRYYGSTTMRKLVVGNQGPYLKTLMKRGFYYYKPSLRLKKTLYIAAMRRGFRKKSRKQKNLSLPVSPNQLTLGYSNENANFGNKMSPFEPSEIVSGRFSSSAALRQNDFITDRSSYSILNKRASRYRHQIYKDVLQHWYYTPFNRLALKFDIDAFINRQPKKHFLTKNEERLLHVKRFLLSAHYDSLRWYTYMQHYRTMKTNIGGTKSFASRIYNQQFQGTFKKIRHLFAITPNYPLNEQRDLDSTFDKASVTHKNQDVSILKFDQALYNDNNLSNKKLIYLHEELFNQKVENFNSLLDEQSDLVRPSDLPAQEVNSLQTNSKQNNGELSSVGSGDLINQSQSLILNAAAKNTMSNTPSSSFIFSETPLSKNMYTELLVKLIKECKRQIYDQTFLKNYITHRIEKREKRNQEQTKELTKRLEKLKTWLNFYNNSAAVEPLINAKSLSSNYLTTGIQKALNDSTLISGDYAKTKLEILMKSSPISTYTPSITNLDWWRQKQKAITKRKNARKRERFKKQIAGVKLKLDKLEKMKLKGPLSNSRGSTKLTTDISSYVSNIISIDTNLLRKKQDNNLWQQFFMQRLSKVRRFAKKKSSRGSRYRALTQSPYGRYLSATRKPKMVAGLSPLNGSKIDRISSPSGVFLNKIEKQKRVASSSTPLSNLEKSLDNNIIRSFVTNEKKNYEPVFKNIQVRHNWKKYKRFKFNTSQNKYRKRRVKSRGKFREMSKKFKKIKAAHELKKWWWNSFLPRYYQTLTPDTNSVNSQTAFKPLSTLDNISVPSKASLDNTMHLSDPIKSNGSKNTSITTSLPFYAGWDESLRKFIVTNRFLTRRDTGSLTGVPVQGLNEGSFLYWQTDMPFNSYNIDQFIATNQSVYAPLGWRRFEFRHSILKSWNKVTSPLQNLTTNFQGSGKSAGTIILEASNTAFATEHSSAIASLHQLSPVHDQIVTKAKIQKIKLKKALARRVKKRHKLVNKMPSQLIYTPTGPLLIEILPSHYISIFDQQYRFPRNRYLKRRLLKSTKKTTLLAMLDSASNYKNMLGSDLAITTKATQGLQPMKEFTLRKRVKPRRKYHRKRFIKKDGLIFPRRTKFTKLTGDLASVDDNLRWRPHTKQKRNISERAKMQTNKRLKTNPLRLRQLRRREFQQILKPTQRYQPRNGGFTWPGDYLRLEIVEMPKLKIEAKQKIGAQPVGITPRKYLIEKHNILVLKKKLQKAHETKNLAQAIKEYKVLTQNNIV